VSRAAILGQNASEWSPRFNKRHAFVIVGAIHCVGGGELRGSSQRDGEPVLEQRKMIKTQSKKLDLPWRAGRSDTQGPGIVSSSGYESAVQNGRTTGWDPHEVWLTRVKQPRDRRSAG
jgi:hypothetical protein